MKHFNYTGTCIPEKHYMVDISRKIEQIYPIIEQGNYFTINRPRQYGKSTTLLLLEKHLLKMHYLPLSISFEGIGDTVFKNEKRFCITFTELLSEALEYTHNEYSVFLMEQCSSLTNLKSLSRLITQFIKKTDKNVILIIDEVDKSSNNQLFLSFLGMLRDKYLRMRAGKDCTYHSVILAGVHDIKTLKLRLRPFEQQKYNSPWNIAFDFQVDLSFSAIEIATMLTDYVKDKKVDMDIQEISEKLDYYTSGYPFLVSKLCYIIDNRVITNKKWTLRDVDESVRHILEENNTNFESLIKNLENNPELYKLIKRITLENDEIPMVRTDPIISLGITYGILKDTGSGICEIHNHIYAQLIYNHMMMRLYHEENINGVTYSSFKKRMETGKN